MIFYYRALWRQYTVYDAPCYSRAISWPNAYVGNFPPLMKVENTYTHRIDRSKHNVYIILILYFLWLSMHKHKRILCSLCFNPWLVRALVWITSFRFRVWFPAEWYLIYFLFVPRTSEEVWKLVLYKRYIHFFT